MRTELRRRPGRPALPLGERRSCVVNCRVTDREYRQLAAVAASQGVTMSALVRWLMFGGRL